MRIFGRDGPRGLATRPAAEEAPAWWAPLFADRQRRLRKRILKALADGEQGTTAIYYRLTQFDRPETDHALCTLSADGLIACRRAVEPRRHRAGPGDVIEVTYWRLAEG